MRKENKDALESVRVRVDLTPAQMKELCMLLSCTAGPLIIASIIEQGLLHYRNIKKKKRCAK